jgi:hypothetical protein
MKEENVVLLFFFKLLGKNEKNSVELFLLNFNYFNLGL